MDNWKLTIRSQKGETFINRNYEKRRIRFWNGKAIGLKLSSKGNPVLLKAAFELKLLEGWRPPLKPTKEIVANPTVVEVISRSPAFKTSTHKCSKAS